MSSNNFIANTQMLRQSGEVAGGVTAIDCSSIEVQGADSITWVCSIATQASTGICAIALQGRDNSGESWIDLSSDVALPASHTSAGAETGNVIAIELVRPTTRYVRAEIRRTIANTAIESVFAFIAGPRDAPVTQPAQTYAFVSDPSWISWQAPLAS